MSWPRRRAGASRSAFIGATVVALFGLSTPLLGQSAEQSEGAPTTPPSAVSNDHKAARPVAIRQLTAAPTQKAAHSGSTPAQSAAQPAPAQPPQSAPQAAPAPTLQSASQPAPAPSPQVAAQVAPPQTTTAQPAAADVATNFQVDQQLQAAGVKTCLPSAAGIARSEMVGVTEYAASSTWNKVAPDQRLVSAVIGQRFGQSAAAPVGLSGVVSAPNGNGKCDSVAIQVIPTANACTSVQTQVLAKGQLLGTLAGVPMLRNEQNMHVMLLPTPGDGCVIVALNNLYAE
jgi:hypothetical protein